MAGVLKRPQPGFKVPLISGEQLDWAIPAFIPSYVVRRCSIMKVPGLQHRSCEGTYAEYSSPLEKMRHEKGEAHV